MRLEYGVSSPQTPGGRRGQAAFARRATHAPGERSAPRRTFRSRPCRREYFADNLDAYDGLDEATLDAINRTNALSLFPRLARND